MPHASFKIKPGVDQNETPALNQAGLSKSNLIRFIYDRSGNGLVQKLGGWTKYYSGQFNKIIRAIWPWEDANANTHLAVGSENGSNDFQGQLSVITNGTLKDVTPRNLVTNVLMYPITSPIPQMTTIGGSSIVQIYDPNIAGINQYDSVYISVPVSIGGLVLFGLYECISVGGNTYAVQAVDTLGNPVAAKTSSSSPVLPSISTTAGSSIATVTFTDHGYTVGSTFTVLIPTIIGGLTFSGDYIVQTVPTVNTFTIFSTSNATGATPTTASINNNQQNYTYNFGIGVAGIGSGYGIYGYGYNTPPNYSYYGSGATVAPSSDGVPIPANNWVMDNWGSYLITTAISDDIVINAVSATSSSGTSTIGFGANVVSTNADFYVDYPYSFFVPGHLNVLGYQVSGAYIQAGSVVTYVEYYESTEGWAIYIDKPLVGLISDTFSVPITFISQETGKSYKIPLGQSVTLSGFYPTSWNQNVVVTASTNNTISFSATLPAATVLGTIQINYAPYQPIYLFDPTSGNPIATTIPNAPVYNQGVFVAMPQRQIVSVGSTFTGVPDPLLIRWSDVNDLNSWVGTVTNQAGSYRLPKGSKIVGAFQAPQQALIFTDLGVWAMQYIGPPYVYGFNELGTGCGLIARKAVASLAGGVYWMGNSQFFTISGNGVQVVPCPIWDVIFQDLDTSNLDKIRVAVNSLFGEISWYYPSLNNSGEINSYVKYNVNLQCWDFGTLSRSAWTDQSVLGKPIGADPISGYLYQHETTNDADGTPMLSSFRTGYFAMSEADVKSFVDEVWPDMKWGFYEGNQTAQVYITFYVTDFAGQQPEVYGPYTMTQATKWFNPRFRGRLVSIEISSNDLGSFWRLGNIRYRIQQDGRY